MKRENMSYDSTPLRDIAKNKVILDGREALFLFLLLSMKKIFINILPKYPHMYSLCHKKVYGETSIQMTAGPSSLSH